MEFDPEYGMVERGTAGHRASAQVVDVAAEIAALDRIMASPPTLDPDWLRSELAFGTTAREAMAQGARNRARQIQWTRESRAAVLREARLYAGFDVGQDGATVMTTYRVEGDTLRIVHTAMLPARVQTMDVTMTIGGE